MKKPVHIRPTNFATQLPHTTLVVSATTKAEALAKMLPHAANVTIDDIYKF